MASGVEVRLCPSPDAMEETFVLCRSPGRKEKENAILNRFVVRLEDKLTKLAERAAQGKLKDRQKVERQIGRLLEQNSRAASLFTVAVTEKNARVSIEIKRNEERYTQALETGGSYILRTNWKETDPKTLWETYIQLTEVEDAFRTAKHDLGMRPIFQSEKGENPGPHTGLLPLPGTLADSATMDEDIGPWHGAEKTAGRDEGDQIPRCHLACTRQNHQAQGRGHRLTATQGLALEDENSTPQQTSTVEKLLVSKLNDRDDVLQSPQDVIERIFITTAPRITNSNISRASKLLEINRHALSRKPREMGTDH